MTEDEEDEDGDARMEGKRWQVQYSSPKACLSNSSLYNIHMAGSISTYNVSVTLPCVYVWFVYSCPIHWPCILYRSEKGGLKKTSPSYIKGGIFSRLGARGSSGDDRGDGGRGGVFGRLNWGGGGGGGGGGGSRGPQWHKVTIPRGGNHDQDQLIQMLQSGIDASLQPSNVCPS